MKKLYEMLDEYGEPIGIVSTVMEMVEIKSLWDDYCTTYSDDPLDIEEFLLNWVRPKDQAAERIFVVEVTHD